MPSDSWVSIKRAKCIRQDDNDWEVWVTFAYERCQQHVLQKNGRCKGKDFIALGPGSFGKPLVVEVHANGTFKQELLEETLVMIITQIAQEIEQDMAKASTCRRSQVKSPSRMPPRSVYRKRSPTAVPAPWAGVSRTPLIPRPMPVYRGSHPPPPLPEVLRPASPTSTRGQSSGLTLQKRSKGGSQGPRPPKPSRGQGEHPSWKRDPNGG